MVSNETKTGDGNRMKAYIASRIPEEGCRVVLADGPDGEVWADLDPVRQDNGEFDLHWETNCREAVVLRDIFMHFRRHEMTVDEWRRDFSGAVACLRVQRIGIGTSHRNEKSENRGTNKPMIDCTVTEDAMGLPKEVSTAEAARILGVSKDTVLKLKAKGLLEYRIASPPGSCRPVFRFLLQSVLRLRTGYEADEPTPGFPRESARRHAVPRIKKYKHVKLED